MVSRNYSSQHVCLLFFFTYEARMYVRCWMWCLFFRHRCDCGEFQRHSASPLPRCPPWVLFDSSLPAVTRFDSHTQGRRDFHPSSQFLVEVHQESGDVFLSVCSHPHDSWFLRASLRPLTHACNRVPVGSPSLPFRFPGWNPPPSILPQS